MKHLIKNGRIVKSGIPQKFTRDNGELFLGGYQYRTDIHYEDGWRDEIFPPFDPTKEALGEAYYDASTDQVTYVINPLVIDLELERKRQYDELAAIRSELASLILQAQLNNDPEPQELLDLITLIKQMYVQAKEDIASLTQENILKYKLRSPELAQATQTLTSFL